MANKKSLTLPYYPCLTHKELKNIETFTKELAKASGDLAMSYYGKANPILKYDHGIVTEADLAVQDYIYKKVKAVYPEHKFLGEEGENFPEDRELSEPLWVVDPVDGSAAFSASMPVWGVSIALFDGTLPVVGVIHLPVTGELYSVTVGGKAMLDDREIHVRSEAVDNECLLLTYSRFHSDFITHFPGKVRSLGSTAAHMAYVARGGASAAILRNIHIWDIAAGVLLLQAAGGVIYDFKGKNLDFAPYLNGNKIENSFIAGPKNLYRDIKSALETRKNF